MHVHGRRLFELRLSTASRTSPSTSSRAQRGDGRRPARDRHRGRLELRAGRLPPDDRRAGRGSSAAGSSARSSTRRSSIDGGNGVDARAHRAHRPRRGRHGDADDRQRGHRRARSGTTSSSGCSAGTAARTAIAPRPIPLVGENEDGALAWFAGHERRRRDRPRRATSSRSRSGLLAARGRRSSNPAFGADRPRRRPRRQPRRASPTTSSRSSRGPAAERRIVVAVNDDPPARPLGQNTTGLQRARALQVGAGARPLGPGHLPRAPRRRAGRRDGGDRAAGDGGDGPRRRATAGTSSPSTAAASRPPGPQRIVRDRQHAAAAARLDRPARAATSASASAAFSDRGAGASGIGRIVVKFGNGRRVPDRPPHPLPLSERRHLHGARRAATTRPATAPSSSAASASGSDGAARRTLRARLAARSSSATRPWLMGVLNANPDSFSGPGGELEGADIVDVGGESAITNRPAVGAAEEIARVVPVVERLARGAARSSPSTPTSPRWPRRRSPPARASSTTSAACATRALADVCARTGAALVVMHTAAAPKERLQDPGAYDDVVADVGGVPARADRRRRSSAGWPPEQIVVDPGPGLREDAGADDRGAAPPRRAARARASRCCWPSRARTSSARSPGAGPRERGAGHARRARRTASTPGAHIFRVHDVRRGGRLPRRARGAARRARRARAISRCADELRHEPPRRLSALRLLRAVERPRTAVSAAPRSSAPAPTCQRA